MTCLYAIICLINFPNIICQYLKNNENGNVYLLQREKYEWIKLKKIQIKVAVKKNVLAEKRLFAETIVEALLRNK